MLIKSKSNCPALLANDGCTVYELLHPKNDPIDLSFSLAWAEVKVGQSSYRHRLAQVEVYFIVAGNGVMHIDDQVADVGPGDTVYIPAGAEQWIENSGDKALHFAAIVSPPWREEDDVRLDTAEIE